MDLSIVIVNYKVKALLERCLSSVYKHTTGVDFEVFVIDNASGDGSVEMVREKFPQVRLIANEKNLGFAAGNNPGIKASTGDFILLLNPDTELKDDALAKMVAAMRSRPEIGIAGPKLTYADGVLQPSVQRFPTLGSQALVMLKMHNFFPNLAPLKKYFAADFDYSKTAPVDQVMGAVFMIRRSVIEKIGLLDERFFIWFEEVDYCKRAQEAGFQVWYLPDMSVIHHGGQSFGQVFGPKKQGMFDRSLRRYMMKHHGPLPAAALTALHPAAMLLAWVATRFTKKRRI